MLPNEDERSEGQGGDQKVKEDELAAIIVYYS